MMDIVVANGFAMERCTFFSQEYHCCVLHNTRCKCEDYNPRNSKPITHADRIRAMSDEELVDKFIYGAATYACPPNEAIKDACAEGKDCRECWLAWLKSPVDKEGE